MATLEVREPGRVPYTVSIGEELRIGRDPENHLVLADRQASRLHAEILPRPEGLELVDLGSRHGTFVNGARAERWRLADGDRIQVGSTHLVFIATDEDETVIHLHTTAVDAEPGDPVTPEGRRLRLLQELGQAVAALEDPGALLSRMLAAIVDALGARRGVVGLVPAAGGTPRRIAQHPRPAGDELAVPRQILGSVLAGQAVALRIALGAPMSSGGRVLGFVYVDDPARPAPFGDDDLRFLSALAVLAGGALAGAERVQRASAIEEEQTEPPALLGESPAMRELAREIARYAPVDTAHVVIRGETGTGKELVARSLHAQSPRRERAFVALNCAALPEAMIEAELFGHVRGAFTGATRDRRGRFALADGGTLFLDEAADLSPSAQAKLLRALEYGEIQPLGSERVVRVDVRVLSATHKDLEAEIAAGRFRDDLYYRLHVVDLEIAPLRERGDDVLLLAQTFLARSARRLERTLVGFQAPAEQALKRYAWPGNVRELASEVERAAIVAEGTWVTERDLGPRLRGRAAPTEGRSLAARYAEIAALEARLLEEGMREAGGNVSRAARLLGMTRMRMRRRLARQTHEPHGGD